MSYDKLGILQVTHEMVEALLGLDQIGLCIVTIKDMHDMNDTFEIVVQDVAENRQPNREILRPTHSGESIPIVDIGYRHGAEIEMFNNRVIENADRFDIPDNTSDFEL